MSYFFMWWSIVQPRSITKYSNVVFTPVVRFMLARPSDNIMHCCIVILVWLLFTLTFYKLIKSGNEVIQTYR